jgi:hypothetical protein
MDERAASGCEGPISAIAGWARRSRHHENYMNISNCQVRKAVRAKSTNDFDV